MYISVVRLLVCKQICILGTMEHISLILLLLVIFVLALFSISSSFLYFVLIESEIGTAGITVHKFAANRVFEDLYTKAHQ